MADVFISYSRRDQDFVRRLHAALEAAGRAAWVDWEGIPPTAKWMDEVRAAIDAADAFVFVVSPDSAASAVCRQEAEHAAASGKRIVPIVWQAVPEGTLPEAISAHNWLFMRASDDFAAGLTTLLTALDTDLEWVHAHTRLVTRAREWETNRRERSYLLRGRDLAAAEGQLASAARRNPSPTPLQTEYVFASRQAERRGQRLRTAFLSGGLVFALVLAGFALFQLQDAITQRSRADQQASEADTQRQAAVANATEAVQQQQEAERQRQEADKQRQAAETQQQLAEQRRLEAEAQRRQAVSRQLAAQSVANRSSPDLSALLALEGLNTADTPEARSSLFSALLAEPQLVRLMRMDGEVTDVGATRAGDIVAATSTGGLSVWSSAGRQLVSHPGGEGNVAPILSHDGTLLAFAGGSPLTIWDTLNGSELVSLAQCHGPDASGFSIFGALSDGDAGRLAVICDNDRTAVIFDARTGHKIAEFAVGDRHTSETLTAITRDGRFLAVATVDNHAAGQNSRVALYEIDTGRRLASLPWVHGPTILSAIDLTFSPDGDRFAAAFITGRDETNLGGVVTLDSWSTSTFQRSTFTRSLSPGTRRAGDIAFGPTGNTLAVTAGDSIELVTPGKRQSRSIPVGCAGGDVIAVTFSTAGEVIAAICGGFNGESHSAQVFVTGTGKPLLPPLDTHAISGSSVAFTPDGSLVTGALDFFTGSSVMTAWDLGRTARLAEVVTDISSAGHGSVEPDRRHLVTDTGRGEAAVWDLAVGRRSASASCPQSRDDSPTYAILDPAGTQVACATGESADVDIFDVQSGSRLRTLSLPDTGSYTHGLNYSPDGKTLAIAYQPTDSPDAFVVLWDVATGQRAELDAKFATFTELIRFSADSSLLAIASGPDILLWDASERQLLATLQGHESDISAMAFSSDGSFLVSGSRDGTVTLWDIASGSPLGTSLGSLDSGVQEVAISPDGSLVAATQYPATTVVWDTRLGAEVWDLPGAYVLAFTPDGGGLWTRSGDDLLRWNIDPSVWREQACAVANRNLTADEWQRYLPDDPYRSTCP